MRTLTLILLLALTGCANTGPMSSCDMAATLYRSDRPDVHRQGDTFIQQGACR